MKIFSSGAHAKLTTDPEAWLFDGFRATEGMAKSQRKWSTVWYEPRPEFDRPLTNPANPILDNLRWAVTHWDEDVEADGPYADRYHRWLHYVEWEDLGFSYTPEQREHALDVLARLAVLQESIV